MPYLQTLISHSPKRKYERLQIMFQVITHMVLERGQTPYFSLPDWAIPARIFLITRQKEVPRSPTSYCGPSDTLKMVLKLRERGTEFDLKAPTKRYLNLHDFCVFPEGGFHSEADEGGKYFNEKHEYVRDQISHTTDAANARMIPLSSSLLHLTTSGSVARDCSRWRPL